MVKPVLPVLTTTRLSDIVYITNVTLKLGDKTLNLVQQAHL